MIGLLTALASTNCSAIESSLASLPNTIWLVTSMPCSGCPPVRCANQIWFAAHCFSGVSSPSLGQRVIYHWRQPPLLQLPPELGHPAFARRRRRFVNHTRKLHRQRRSAHAQMRPPRLDRAHDRRIRDLQHADEIDARRVQPPADIAILMPGQTSPVRIRHDPHRNRFVIRVGHVLAEPISLSV